MKILIVAAIRCSLMFLMPSVTYAISAQWDLDPISGDWNTADNWTPNGVPNGPADIATFGLSNTRFVSISEDTEVNTIIFTPAATNPYFIIVNSDVTLTISGVGIKNNSGNGQTLSGGQIRFTNSSTAGNAFIDTIDSTNFFDSSTAGNASIQFSRSTNFFDRSTAGNAFIGIHSSTNFFDRSTAGNAFIDTEGGSTNFFDRSTADNSRITVHFGSAVNFFDRSTAGSASLGEQEEGFANFFDNSTAGSANIFFPEGDVSFFGNSTAGSANIGEFRSLHFADNSTAGSATIFAGAEQGGFISISFEDSSQGGTAAIGLFHFFSTLDISGHDAPGVTIGSLEGDEVSNVFLGGNNLTVGSNNLSTIFSGVIQDGGQNGGTGGSLTKIGSGTFILSGANTYTGDTNVNRGVLQVDGSITSNTFVNRGATLAGTGTIDGNLTNNGKVSPGSAGAPGMLTVVHNYTQAQYATLMIQIAGASAGEFSVLNVLGTANLSGHLDPVLLNGFVPTIGESFTFLTYGSLNGTLFIFNRNIDDLPEHWELSYLPTSAIMTVAAGNVPVPDQGPTFLLLTLGLLGLVTFRRQLLREQP